MALLGVSFHLQIEDQGLVLSAIFVPLASNQFMLCPWAVSFFRKLCPALFPPVTPPPLLRENAFLIPLGEHLPCHTLSSAGQCCLFNPLTSWDAVTGLQVGSFSPYLGCRGSSVTIGTYLIQTWVGRRRSGWGIISPVVISWQYEPGAAGTKVLGENEATAHFEKGIVSNLVLPFFLFFSYTNRKICFSYLS